MAITEEEEPMKGYEVHTQSVESTRDAPRRVGDFPPSDLWKEDESYASAPDPPEELPLPPSSSSS